MNPYLTCLISKQCNYTVPITPNRLCVGVIGTGSWGKWNGVIIWQSMFFMALHNTSQLSILYFLNDLYGYTTEYQAFCQFHISFTHGQIEYANNIDFGE